MRDAYNSNGCFEEIGHCCNGAVFGVNVSVGMIGGAEVGQNVEGNGVVGLVMVAENAVAHRSGGK